MKATIYKGWKIYQTTGGSFGHLRQVNARNPLRVGRLSAAVPDSGNSEFAVRSLKRDIDALEAQNPTCG